MAEIRFNSDDPDIRLEFFEPEAHAHQRAGRSYGRNKMRDPAFALLPDFEGRAVVVGERICGVIVLVGDEVFAGILALQAINGFNRSIRAEMRRGPEKIGSQGGQDLAALLAHGFAHGKEDFIVFDRTHKSETDARVAAGRLKDHFVAVEFARRFGGFNHGFSNAVFHRSAGICAFELCPDFDIGIRTDPPESNKRSIANKLERATCKYGSFHDCAGYHGSRFPSTEGSSFLIPDLFQISGCKTKAEVSQNLEFRIRRQTWNAIPSRCRSCRH